MTERKPIDLDEPRFRDQHIEIAEMPVIGRVVRNASNCPLDTYEKRGYIDGRQHEAGTLFARDYRVIAASEGVVDYQRLPANTNMPEFTAIAAERWRNACQHIGKIGSSLAVWVCCEDKTVNDWAHSQGKDRKYGTERFRECLDDLADFYGVPKPAA